MFYIMVFGDRRSDSIQLVLKSRTYEKARDVAA